MGFFKKVGSAISGLFGRPKSSPGGGSLAELASSIRRAPPRDDRERGRQRQRGERQRGPGRPSSSPDPRLPPPFNIDPKSPAARFLLGEWVSVTSSNVDRISYELGKNGGTLKVIFKDQNEYHYWPVSPDEAVDLLQTGSKGGWVWDHLRIRKTALGHQKNYVHVAGHGAVQRKWIETPEKMTAHLRRVGEESVNGIVGTIPESVPFEFFLTEPPTK